MTAIPLNPANSLDNAVLAYKAGRLDEAERICQRILAVQPAHFEAVHILAVIQAALGKAELAVKSYDRALAVRPNSAEVLSNRGVALESLNRFDDALSSYDRSLALRPDSPEAWYNRGNVMRVLSRHDEALASYERAVALRPHYADAHNNRGQTLRDLKRYEEALTSYDAALAADPTHTMAHCNAAAVRLLLGHFKQGWVDYEWRWKKPSVIRLNRNFPQPQWRGEDIASKTILLHSEQGFGDTIQFCRYVPLVVARGARVILEVQRQLCTLMADIPGATEVIARGSPLPTFDVHCPLLSLPLAFATELETIPAERAYLSASREKAGGWHARLAAQRRTLVGLAWSGSRRHEGDRERSIALDALIPLLAANVTIVSLQKDVRPADAGTLNAHRDILHFGDEWHDFSDTAALISELDLVISVDTSVAHLAAALGKPTWILLPEVPDFRWLLEREDSPWYPTVRLFRQDSSRDWNCVIARVQEALRAFR